MEEKRILIFGDSYSTFVGYIPAHYATCYPCTVTGVTKVEQTWWHLLCEEVGATVALNDSWSGSTVCNMGYDGDCSKVNSFIYRLELLIKDGFFKKNVIDRVFVFGGTNDSWSNNECGELQFSNWSEEDLLLILPGYAYFINKLLSVLPKEKIHVIINSELREDVTQGFLDICKHYGVVYTMLSNIEKIDGHPTPAGMVEIKNQILSTY